MLISKWLAAFLCLLTALAPLDARTKKGDRLLKSGREAEVRKEWDKALDLYEQALSEDPGDSAYLLSVNRARFQASQAHVDRGQKLREQGQLAEALAGFEKGYAIDPSSAIAVQEIRRTQEMIEREKTRKTQASPEERALTPVQAARKDAEDRIASMQAAPQLAPLNPQPINLKMNNQPPKVLFETVGKLAGINVLFDPEYSTQGAVKNQNLDLNNLTLEEALDHVALVTTSFWKPLSANTIFVTANTTPKRRDHEEQVMKVFYLTNVTTPQELQEILTTVRSVADIQRLFPYNAQNAIVARGEADRIALAEKIIADLDKPKAEVVIDVIVMEANKVRSRDLAAGVGTDGLNIPVAFTPRPGVRTPGQPSSGNNNNNQNGTGAGTSTGTLDTATPSPPGSIPLANLGRLSTGDFSVVLPGALLQALVSDRSTRVLQSPQLRALDSQKATLRIGDKVPTATGSFQPGIGGVGINPLVNTQFTFIEVGVNVDVTPKIHGPEDVTLQVSIEISNVRDRINLGGISQPVIGQRKIEHFVRLREGEVNMIGGLVQEQDTKTVTGVPGLSSIPVVRRLFSKETIEKSDSELLVVLVPHIVRAPDITESNLKGIAVGNQNVIKLNYAPRKLAESAPAGGSASPAAAPGGALAPPAPGPAAPDTGVAPAAPGKPAAAPPAAAPQAGTGLLFAPPKVQTQLSSAFSVSVMVEDAKDLFAAPMQIRFDPKILRLSDVVRGGFLSSDGQAVMFTKNILNEAGEAAVTLHRFPGAGGVGGSGTLATLTFQAVGRGTAVVSIPQMTLRDSGQRPLLSGTPEVQVLVE